MANVCFFVRAGIAMGLGKGHRMRTQRHAYLSLNCVANISVIDVIGLQSLEPDPHFECTRLRLRSGLRLHVVLQALWHYCWRGETGEREETKGARSYGGFCA